MFDQIRSLVQEQPFRPFRIHMNDGRAYDVRHPEMIAIGRSAVSIAVPPEDGDYFAICQVRNIASLETLAENRKTG